MFSIVTPILTGLVAYVLSIAVTPMLHEQRIKGGLDSALMQFEENLHPSPFSSAEYILEILNEFAPEQSVELMFDPALDEVEQGSETNAEVKPFEKIGAEPIKLSFR